MALRVTQVGGLVRGGVFEIGLSIVVVVVVGVVVIVVVVMFPSPFLFFFRNLKNFNIFMMGH